jgi:hypothetical protein
MGQIAQTLGALALIRAEVAGPRPIRIAVTMAVVKVNAHMAT